jgi:hypothetical protein
MHVVLIVIRWYELRRRGSARCVPASDGAGRVMGVAAFGSFGRETAKSKYCGGGRLNMFSFEVVYALNGSSTSSFCDMYARVHP